MKTNKLALHSQLPCLTSSYPNLALISKQFCRDCLICLDIVKYNHSRNFIIHIFVMTRWFLHVLCCSNNNTTSYVNPTVQYRCQKRFMNSLLKRCRKWLCFQVVSYYKMRFSNYITPQLLLPGHYSLSVEYHTLRCGTDTFLTRLDSYFHEPLIKKGSVTANKTEFCRDKTNGSHSSKLSEACYIL